MAQRNACMQQSFPLASTTNKMLTDGGVFNRLKSSLRGQDLVSSMISASSFSLKIDINFNSDAASPLGASNDTDLQVMATRSQIKREFQTTANRTPV